MSTRCRSACRPASFEEELEAIRPDASIRQDRYLGISVQAVAASFDLLAHVLTHPEKQARELVNLHLRGCAHWEGHYQNITRLRQARNRWIHSLDPVEGEVAGITTRVAGEMLNGLWGLGFMLSLIGMMPG